MNKRLLPTLESDEERHSMPAQNPVWELADRATNEMEEVFNFVHQNDTVPFYDVKVKVLPAVLEVANRPDVFRLFAALQAKDDYLYRHNAGVGAIATLLGAWLGLEDEQLSELAIAAILHDVGKVKVPIDILTKPGKLTDEEFTLMKNHTVFGYQLLRETQGVSQQQCLVALQHHERENGTGYPLRLTGDRMDWFSKIVAVADVFHAMSSQRVYQQRHPFYHVIAEIQQGVYEGLFEPRITTVFIQGIMNRLVGTEVRISDGRTGTIVLIQPTDLVRPLVRVGDLFVNLSQERSIVIEEVLAD